MPMPQFAALHSLVAVLCNAVDNYSYLVNGDAMAEVEAFIANEESTYEQYVEV